MAQPATLQASAAKRRSRRSIRLARRTRGASAKIDLAQQPREEEAAVAGQRPARIETQVEGALHAGEQTVDRGAGLSGTGQIDTAQHRWRLVAGDRERRIEKALQRRHQRRDLGRKRLDHGATFGIALRFQPVERSTLEALDEQGDLASGTLARSRSRGPQRKREAPHLLAGSLIEVAEHLAETRDQIRFGDQQIDGKVEAQSIAELSQAAPYRLRDGLPARSARSRRDPRRARRRRRH